jgi:hypothetical protein
MRKAAILSAIVFALMIALVFNFESAIRYYRRSQAEDLLATVRTLHPGITQAQTIQTLIPFARWKETENDEEIYFSLDNNPTLIPASLQNVPHLPLTPPWTMFTAEFRFYLSRLAEIRITEMQQDHPGYPHPNSASTRIHSFAFIETHMDDQVPYSSNSQTTGGVDERGNWTNFKCCYERFIMLDERATPAQFTESLNFQLHCLTSFRPCKDDRAILP